MTPSTSQLVVAPRTVAILATALSAAGCGGDTASTVPPPVLTLPTQFSGVIDPSGRTIEIEGLTVVVPPNAVRQPTNISIEPVATPEFDGAEDSWFSFSPAGLNFAEPLELWVEGVRSDEELGKWIQQTDQEGQLIEVIQKLPQIDHGDRRQAFLRGFSRVGRLESFVGVCIDDDAPRIVRVGYDECDDRLELEWDSVSPVWVQVGYRPNDDAPVTWGWLYVDRPEDGLLRVPPEMYPPASSPPYTFVFRVFHPARCDDQIVLSPPGFAEVVAPLPFAPRSPDSLTARRVGQTVELRWDWARRPDGSIDLSTGHAGFEVSRSPPWPDGDVRTVAPDALVFADREVTPRNQAFIYGVRAIWRQAQCDQPTGGQSVSVVVPSPGDPPSGAPAVQTCGLIRLTVTPAEQTVAPQNETCRAAGTCPNAEFSMVVEHVNGASLFPLGVGLDEPPAFMDKGLISIDSQFIDGPVVFGRSHALLSGGHGESTDGHDRNGGARRPLRVGGPAAADPLGHNRLRLRLRAFGRGDGRAMTASTPQAPLGGVGRLARLRLPRGWRKRILEEANQRPDLGWKQSSRRK